MSSTARCLVSNYDARQKCKVEAIRLGFSIRLFGRIPIHYFDYFRAENPFDSVNVPIMTHLEIITVFMIINDLDIGLLMAFYNASGAELDTVLRMSTFLHRMWNVYRQTEHRELMGRFGNVYAFHLGSRTLRYIDGTVCVYADSQRRGGRFVPDEPSWVRLREVRNLIKNHRFPVEDDYDQSMAQAATRSGLMFTGRKM